MSSRGDYKSDLKVIAVFFITMTLWIGVSEFLIWIANKLMDHNHYFWAIPFVITGALMTLAAIIICLKMAWRLWTGRNIREL